MGLFKSIIVTLGGNLVTGFGSLILAIVISRELGPEGKGILTFFIVLATLVAMVVDSGVSIANVFYYRTKNIKKKILFWNGVIWSFVVGGMSAVMVFFGVTVMGHSSADDPVLLLLALSCIPLYVYISLQGQLLLGLDKVKAYNISCIVQPMTTLFAVQILFFLYGASVQMAIIAYVVGLLTVVAYQFGAASAGNFQVHMSTLASSVKFGFVGHLGTIAQFCNYRLDVIILGVLRGDEAVGIYSISFTLGEVLWRLPRAVGMILYPKVSASSLEDATNITVKVFKFSNLALLLIGIPFAFVGAVCIPYIFGESFKSAVAPFLVILPGILFFSWNNILVEDLKGRGMPNIKFYIAIFVLLVTVVLDLLLIPKFGVMGAAWASTVAYSFAGFISVVVFSRCVGIQVSQLFVVTQDDLLNATSLLLGGVRKVKPLKQQ